MSNLGKNKFSDTAPVPYFGSLPQVRNKRKCRRLKK